MASRPEDHLVARVAGGDCSLGVTARSPTWAGSVMKDVLADGYPYPVDAQYLHSTDLSAINELVRLGASHSWCELSINLRLGPSKRAQLCPYHQWFPRLPVSRGKPC